MAGHCRSRVPTVPDRLQEYDGLLSEAMALLCEAARGSELGLASRTKDDEMTHMKLQAALDELERLCDTVKGFKERNNGKLPNPDSDAGRALSSLEAFTTELHKLNIGKILDHKL